MERFRNSLVGIAALVVLTAIGTVGYMRLEVLDTDLDRGRSLSTSPKPP